MCEVNGSKKIALPWCFTVQCDFPSEIEYILTQAVLQSLEITEVIP